MEQRGMNIQVIPVPNRIGEYGILISHNVWDEARCQMSRVVVNEQIPKCKSEPSPEDLYHWMDHLLAHVREVMHSELCGPHEQTPRIHGPRYRDTTEKPFLS